MANTFAQHLLKLTRNCVPSSPRVKQSSPRRGTTYGSVVLLMAVGAVDANAAKDGVVAAGGSASSGSTNISLVIPERLDVQGIADVGLSIDPQGRLSGQTSACISGHGSDQYHLSAIGSGHNGAFEATQGDSAVGFEVTFSTDTTRPLPVTMGEALERLSGAGIKGCDDNASNATLSLRVKDTHEPRAGSDLPLRGALTLLLSPE